MQFFLSYSEADREAAVALARALEKAGVSVWCSALPGCLVPGRPWIEGLETGLESCSGYLILIGKRPIESWLRAELDYALNRYAREQDFPVVPLLLPGIDFDELKGFLVLFQGVQLESDLEESAADLARELKGQVPERWRPEQPEVNPFPGLKAFEENQARFFFGRDHEVLELVSRLGRTKEGYRRWLQIEGASGAGKSSLARAGLLPAVRRGWIDGRPAAWRVAVLRPGHDPLSNLARALSHGLEGLDGVVETETIYRRLEHSDRYLSDLLDKHLEAENSFLLLLLDQLEDAFTLADCDASRLERLDAVLASAIEDRDSRLHLVTTIRSDFVNQFSLLPRLERLLNKEVSRYHLPRMTTEGLTLAVTRPASLAGLRWQPPDLPQTIVQEASRRRSGLPLMAHVLRSLWRGRRDKVLLHAVYRDLGGLGGALAKDADALMERLEPHLRDRARDLLLSLVQIGRGAEDVRKVLPRSEALAAAGGGRDAEHVLLQLSGQRDLEAPPDIPPDVRLVSVGDNEQVELAHEELLRSWNTLGEWVKDERDCLERRDRLEAAAQAWIKAGEPPGGSLDAEMLIYYRRAKSPNKDAKRYLQESERRLHRRKQEREKRLRRGKLAVSAVLVAALAFGINKGFEWRELRQVERQDERVVADLVRLTALEEDALMLMPGAPGSPAAIEAWLLDARRFLEGTDRRRLESRRQQLLDSDLPQSENWRVQTIDQFLAKLDSFTETEESLMVKVEQHSRQAQENQERFRGLSPEPWEKAWRRVNQSIHAGRECPAYRQREVEPHEDLYPVGIDPVTRLWEFAHMRSGRIPERDEASGRLELAADAGIVFVLIPGGSFLMGAERGEIRRQPPWPFQQEAPAHQALLSTFFISKYEMTRGQWERLRGQNSSWPDGTDLRPATGISWDKLTETLRHLGLELPSEAQWEYACRAGTETPWWTGDEEADLDKAAWYQLNFAGWYDPSAEQEARVVGQKEANPWGLHDVHGNVSEWCADMYGTYREEEQINPVGPSSGSHRVVRGGGYWELAAAVRSTYRSGVEPWQSYFGLGFRTALPAVLREEHSTF